MSFLVRCSQLEVYNQLLNFFELGFIIFIISTNGRCSEPMKHYFFLTQNFIMN